MHAFTAEKKEGCIREPLYMQVWPEVANTVYSERERRVLRAEVLRTHTKLIIINSSCHGISS